MLVLGLDPSLTNFGWALHQPFEEGSNRCVGRGRFQTSSSMEYIDRYVYLRDSLSAVLEETKPDYVGIEYPIFKDMYSEGMYGLFLFCSEALKKAKKDVVFFSPGQVKALARETIKRPKGWKMEKSDMVDAAKEDVKATANWNHNEADAYLIARSASRFWRLFKNDLEEVDLSPVEKKMFLEIHTFLRGKKAGETHKRGILHREDNRFFLWSQSS